MSNSYKQLIITCKELINNKISVIDASRYLCELRFDLNLDDDKDLMIFIAIDSESDHLPTTKTRAKWSGSGLIKADIELSKIESHYNQIAIGSAKALIKRFEAKIL